jgi:hypothetical protein
VRERGARSGCAGAAIGQRSASARARKWRRALHVPPLANRRGKELQVRTTILNLLETLKAASRKLGPYVLLELLLPGGTLFALALFLYRRQMPSQALAAAAALVARVRARFVARATPTAMPRRTVDPACCGSGAR